MGERGGRKADDEGREGLQVDEFAFVVFHFGRGGGCVDNVMYSIVGVIAGFDGLERARI